MQTVGVAFLARAWLPVTRRKALAIVSRPRFAPRVLAPGHRRLLTVSAMGNQGLSGKEHGVEVYDEESAPKPNVTFTEEELRANLSEQEYNVTQMKGTERAWTGRYLNVKEDGTFACVVCKAELFRTDKKFESGSGWPSFSDVADRGAVVLISDKSGGMTRTEVTCASCGAHLGHVFSDGPKDTGLRYCINGCSLKFAPKDEKTAAAAAAQSDTAKTED